MMHFVGFSKRPEINVVGIFEYFESLMNKNIMHQKIGDPVK
jgi:hypothetical protein